MYYVVREHPEIAMTNEARVLDFLYFCNDLVNLPSSRVGRCVPREGVEIRGLLREPYVEKMSAIFIRHCKQMCEEFYADYFADRDYSWWGDKLPDPRVAMGARLVWPDARYLVLVRDPRDVLCSWRAFARKKNIAEQNPELVDLPADTLAASWKAIYFSVDREIEEHMLLRYEDLCVDPRARVEDFLGYLGLEWTPEVERAFEENDTFRGHGTASSLEASMGRWRKELGSADVDVIQDTCGELMQKFGYQPI